MTTKPKAQKFRIRRSASSGDTPDITQDDLKPESAKIPDAQKTSPEQEIAAIRKEGLTGRQLRMARRVAQKHGLAPTSDFDAIRLLRAKGINPFKRTNTLELVVPEGLLEADQPFLPQTVPTGHPNLPSTNVDSEAARAKAIYKIQRDIAKRRRRKLVFLFTRLAFFVLLPTFLVGYYYYAVATPMYATKSQFIIQKADASSGIGDLLSGAGLSSSPDSVAVQSFLQAREAMQRLDQDHGFKAHFADKGIDPIQRLSSDATNEAAYKLYRRQITISYDPTEGIIKMEVVATDPDISATYSNALISYAEEQVDHMTERVRNDQMEGARDSYNDAEAEMIAAQERVIELQEKSNVISGDVEIGLLTSKISALELELVASELTLEELKSNARPNPAKVDPLERKIASLEAKIAGFRAQLTADSSDGVSIARITSELGVALASLENRNLMMQAALQQLETARIEANRQTRYLSMGVRPTPPDEAAYPRKFENTVLAFLIFAGIYLMMSLTTSILRDQVSA